MENSEKIVFTNNFGTVSDKRVILHTKNGSEDIPIDKISSVAFERKRNIPVGIVFFLVGIGIIAEIMAMGMFGLPSYMILVGIAVFLFFGLAGLAYIVGNYRIKLNVSGVDRKPVKVEMAKTKAGLEFSDAIRKQLAER